jgi:putative transposase
LGFDAKSLSPASAYRSNPCGHLFQNRYKSILCQEEPYFLELVRYIHLNPLRAGLVKDLGGLDTYGYAGHSALMGNSGNAFQDIDSILKRFDRGAGTARKRYRSFVQKGIEMGRRPELIGGGLIRSLGGWASVKALRRDKAYIKGDERILGDGDFVNEVLAKAQEDYEKRYRLASMGLTVDDVAVRVAQLMQMPVEQIWLPGKRRALVQARSLLCFWSVRELGVSMAALGRRLGISCTAVSHSMIRREQIARQNNYKVIEKL